MIEFKFISDVEHIYAEVIKIEAHKNITREQVDVILKM